MTKARIFFILFFLLLIPAVVVYAKETTFTHLPAGDISMDGDQVAWMSHDTGNWDIFYMDLADGVEKQITTDVKTQGYPDVSGNYIVWQDNRHATGAGGFDIYLYDMQSEVETRITEGNGDHRSPIVKDGKIVWIRHTEDGHAVVMYYDISEKTTVQVSSNDANASGLRFDGEVMAWTDFRDADENIYTYSLLDGKETKVTYTGIDQEVAFLENGNVVWTETHNGFSHIYIHNAKENMTRRVSAGAENHEPYAYDGEFLLLKEDGKWVYQSMISYLPEPIDVPVSDPEKVLMHNGDVLIFNGNSIRKESITESIAREKNKPIARETSSDSSRESSAILSEEEERVNFIKTDEETTILSEDKRVKLIFPAGALEQEATIQINQKKLANIKGGYTVGSPLYQFVIEPKQELKKSIQVVFNYADNQMPNDRLTYGLYQQNTDGSWDYRKGTHQRTASTWSTRLDALEPLVFLSYEPTLVDIGNHWSKQYVTTLAAHHIIEGYENHTFKPNNNMTRAEFTTMVVKSLGEEQLDVPIGVFDDISEGHWAANYIHYAYQQGWIKGYDQKFHPHQPISREEMVTILMRIHGVTDNSSQSLFTYKDRDMVSDWAKVYFAEAVSEGFIQGYEGMVFPRKGATRGEVSAFLYRYLEKQGRF